MRSTVLASTDNPAAQEVGADARGPRRSRQRRAVAGAAEAVQPLRISRHRYTDAEHFLLWQLEIYIQRQDQRQRRIDLNRTRRIQDARGDGPD
nr:hypothetical protein [Spelaeibacter cavernicola]